MLAKICRRDGEAVSKTSVIYKAVGQANITNEPSGSVGIHHHQSFRKSYFLKSSMDFLFLGVTVLVSSLSKVIIQI